MTLDVVIARRAGFVMDVRFSAPAGITVLFGPSGAGKSTTLRAIAGLWRPESGRIALGGETWFDAERRIDVPIHERHVAFVFQSLALFPHMTAAANVEYAIARSDGARREKARALLDKLKVGHLAERKPATFSGGEAQRVALARALAMSPKVMLLDEPFSALDRGLRRSLAQELRNIVDETRIPLVLVTHHRNDARALADRIVLMKAGAIESVGSVEDLLPAVPVEETGEVQKAQLGDESAPLSVGRKGT